MGQRSSTMQLGTSVVLALTLAACGASDDDDEAAGDAAAAAPAPTVDVRTTPAATPPGESSAPSTAPATTSRPATTSTVDDGWRQAAAAWCADGLEDYVARPTFETASPAEVVAAVRAARNGSLESIEFPPELRRAPSDVMAVDRQQEALLTDAEAAVAAGDVDATIDLIEHYDTLLAHNAALITVAGAECVGDPARAAGASLNVPVPNVWQVGTGFGSVWASQDFTDTVVRVDATSGDVRASFDVGARAVKSQPADGRMIVRTADAYVAIDPLTDTVVATLAKTDVGPAADRSWAVDGAMWICDGQRLHRYDPATFEPVGVVVELGIDCGQVYATADLVVAWPHNDDEGESGISAAAFVDPATNQLVATTPLPGDVLVPIVLDDAVFFPANLGTVSAVVDRATWQVTATPDYGRMTGGSQAAYDGRAIYVIAEKVDVLVIDAETFELRDVIEPLSIVPDINSVATSPGALWVATDSAGILQRFDIPS
jgi:hypothetical protein